MTVAIIAEYNPFHNGHKYQLSEAKKRFKGEKILIVLSADYLQRGEIAVASWAKRAKAAKAHGADEVVLLPHEYASQAAHIFAEGGVMTAYKHGATKLFFGSESDDAEKLMRAAQTFVNDAEFYDRILKANLKLGYSFPKSSAVAIANLLPYHFEAPNDILGLEYCKIIVKHNLPIKVFTIKRTVGFHSAEVIGEFASATNIREMLAKNQDVSKYTPMHFKSAPPRIEELYPVFQKIIVTTPLSELAEIKFLSEGMHNLFRKQIFAKTYHDFTESCVSRRYTRNRIRRAMMEVMLRYAETELDELINRRDQEQAND